MRALKRPPWWFVLAFLLLMMAVARLASAASLRVCAKDIDPDATILRLYAGSTNAGSWGPPIPASQPDGSVCALLSPVPLSITRGLPMLYTLKAANALGEESPPSNGLSFRLPNVPGAPTFVSVGASVP